MPALNTFLLTIQRVIAGEDWKRDGLIEFAFEGNPQNIERFLDDPRWRERYGTSAEDRRGKTVNDERALQNLLARFGTDREQLRAAVLEAIEDLGTKGWDPRRDSTGYDLVHDDTRFPPKEVLKRAFEICGKKRAETPISGGDPTNGPLRALGYRIENKSPPNGVTDLKTCSVTNVLADGCFIERQRD